MARPQTAKSPTLYIVVVGLWVALLVAMTWTSAATYGAAFQASWAIGAIAVMNTMFIAYFWLNGTKDVVYTLWYHCLLRWRPRPLPSISDRDWTPRVVMVYCTYNDFNAASLRASMEQEYANYAVVILDDSTESAYLEQVDRFATEHGLTVVRRTDKSGAKAGNLNHFLRGTRNWDYVVILDSDEIVPPTFIRRVLDYFAQRPSVGIVQGNHLATRNRNQFMQTFAPGVDSHWMSYQSVKDRYGFMSLLGHGAMVSRQCYEASGGFPHVVAEDICLSIEARRAGYETLFAPDVVCEEEFPVDYLAFKKRHNKWTQGNMEFIRKYTRAILGRGLSWYEKLDVVLFTYSLPLTALFTVYVMVNVVILPAVGYTMQFPLWMLIPTVLFLLAPMLNDIFFYIGKMKTRHLLAYLGHSTVLFGSMYYVSLIASCKSMFGKSTFLVTPKDDRTVSFWQGIHAQRGEIIFAIVLASVTVWLANVLSVLLILLPIAYSFALIAMHQTRRVPVAVGDER